jgi:hypothetical protein
MRSRLVLASLILGALLAAGCQSVWTQPAPEPERGGYPYGAQGAENGVNWMPQSDGDVYDLNHR